MTKKITKDTVLEDILKIKGAQEILAKYNLPCLGCAMAAMEASELKIGKLAEAYGLDLKNMLKDLNRK